MLTDSNQFSGRRVSARTYYRLSVLDPVLIAAVATPTVGPVSSVEPVQGFVGNESFRLLTEDGETFYLKSGATAAIRAEAWACEQARQAGVLAPLVLAAELQPAELPNAYLIERAIPGQAVSESDDAVLAAVGAQLRQLHSITGTGYGFHNEGLRETWIEVIRQPIDNLDILAAPGILPAELVRRLRALNVFERLKSGAPALLHGDLHLRHLYASGGELTGIIDWGDAAFGDPLFDLGRFSRAGPTATDALLRGYAIERTPELDWTLACYRTVWSVMALQWEHAAGGDWFAPHIEAITTDLPYLELS